MRWCNCAASRFALDCRAVWCGWFLVVQIIQLARTETVMDSGAHLCNSESDGVRALQPG